MRARLLELWFIIYAILLLPAWVCAVFITWYKYQPVFFWVSPLMYARYSRSTLNAAIAMILWIVLVTAVEHISVLSRVWTWTVSWLLTL